MSKKRYYLAYGSNTNVEQMRSRCPGAKPIGTAIIKGYALYFKGSKTGYYLTIERKKGGRVPAVVWEVSAANERRLDLYEGCPVCYYKKEMRLPVMRFDGGKAIQTDAFVYIMHEERKLGQPSVQYLKRCLCGYVAFGFSARFLYNACERSTVRSKGVKRR